MYNNTYTVTWIISNTIQEPFSSAEIEIFEAAKEDFNNYFATALPSQTKNRKHIVSTAYFGNKITITFETQKMLPCKERRGNALRQYSRFLAENGFDIYVNNHRLMRAA